MEFACGRLAEVVDWNGSFLWLGCVELLLQPTTGGPARRCPEAGLEESRLKWLPFRVERASRPKKKEKGKEKNYVRHRSYQVSGTRVLVNDPDVDTAKVVAAINSKQTSVRKNAAEWIPIGAAEPSPSKGVYLSTRASVQCLEHAHTTINRLE